MSSLQCADALRHPVVRILGKPLDKSVECKPIPLEFIFIVIGDTERQPLASPAALAQHFLHFDAIVLGITDDHRAGAETVATTFSQGTMELYRMEEPRGSAGAFLVMTGAQNFEP
ncbi:hypothetical protein J2046_003558 [Rhizobium petrolearium]|uniref:hypothetical protein n=1 Tax=Neorhizobium petrolearium TaxID=515361 RepID=UPI001AE80F22|nr:hypothetical protein [Neorhizobium petrolearium]MBP1845289.1 hypothetical protein [Neorhizobium petrolearium]